MNHLKLLDPYEFDDRFVEHTNSCETYEEAYLETEREYMKAFGRRRYSSYNSFRNARRIRLKKRQEEQVRSQDTNVQH